MVLSRPGIGILFPLDHTTRWTMTEMARRSVEWSGWASPKKKKDFAPYTRDVVVNPISGDCFRTRVHII